MDERRASRGWRGFVRRRHFIVNPRVQLRLATFCLYYVLFFALVMTLSIFVPLMVQMEGVKDDNGLALKAARVLVHLDAHYWPAAAATLVAIFLHAIWMSHKFSGPLYRFSRIFREIGQSKIPRRVGLRSGDWLQAEKDALNEMLRGLHAERDRLRSELEALRRRIEVVGASASPEIREALVSVEKRLAELGTDLS